jgi:simple sugar transport system substrate-binding protein
MITLIDAALGAHPAGIAIDYTDRTMEPSVLKAEAEHVDVVLYNNNRFSPQSGGATTNPAVTSLGFSGQNESLSGSILATALLKYLPKSGGTVLLGDAYPNVYVLSLRGEGIKKVLDANGYKTQQLNMSDNEVLDESLVGAYLTAHHGVVGYIGLSGDPETNAAARWVEAHHLNIALATFDVEPETIALMKSVPSFDLALDQQPYLQGYYAVENLALEIEDGFSPVQVNTGSLLVTKQNLPAVERLVNEGVD